MGDAAVIAKQEGRYHHGDLRAALLAATERLVASRGAAAVSLREVAREAGVSHSAPAHHFVNKDGLMLAFAQDGWTRMIEAIGEGLARDKPANGPALLESVGTSYVAFATARPGQFDVMFRRDLYDLSDPGYLGAGETAWSFLSNTIGQCVREGFADARDAETFTIIAWSMVHGLAALWNSGRVRSRFEALDIAELGARANAALTDMMFPGRTAG